MVAEFLRGVPGEFAGRVEKAVGYRYLLYRPEGYGDDPARRWPLILFLHGAGERGDDLNLLVQQNGPPSEIEQGRVIPAVVVAPQCPARQRWDVDALAALLDQIEATERIDADRVYVTGMSMGGNGTWRLAVANPRRFAAIAPICGSGTEPGTAALLAHLPIWVFHGAKDPVVPIAYSEMMVGRLREVGAAPRYTVYPEAEHDSWSETYANPELYDWLLAQRRTGETA